MKINKLKLRRVSPLSCALVTGAMYLVAMVLIAAPALLITQLIGIPVLDLPFIYMVGGLLSYPIMGSVAGLLGAVLYNIVARLTGGLAITMQDEGAAI